MPAAMVEHRPALSAAVDDRSGAESGGSSHSAADPGAGIAIVTAKLRMLAGRISQHVRPVPVRRRYHSAGDALASMFAIADSVTAAGSADAGDPATRMVSDLFAFLAHTKADLAREIGTGPALPPEPANAPAEHRAGGFWCLAALIQDTWEHACEPTTVGRDGQVLEMLAALGWPDFYDFGAGGGYFAFAAAGHGASVQCNEINYIKRRFLRFRRQHIKNRSMANRVHLAGASRRRKWPATLAMDVLDHVADPVSAIEAMAVRIEPGGHLVLQAGFTPDGWHRSGTELIDCVHAALIRNFTIAAARPALGDYGVMLLQRRSRRYSVPSTASPAVRICLDEAASLRSEPDGEGIVIAAPRFFARALRLTPDGARLAEACRARPTLAELRREFEADGISAEIVDHAADALVKARLATLEICA